MRVSRMASGNQSAGQNVALGLIRFYQKAISPSLGPVCRFQPTCSAYTAEAIQVHGVVRGVGLGVRRICRCHPWNRGGFDPVPTNDERSDKTTDSDGEPQTADFR